MEKHYCYSSTKNTSCHFQQHLDKTDAHVRILFMDFTSAFNTVQPQIFKQRLQDLGVSSWLILWIEKFLRNRPQQVCVTESHLIVKF